MNDLNGHYYTTISNLIIDLFLLGKYFDEISQDTGRYCFGVEDTLKVFMLCLTDVCCIWFHHFSLTFRSLGMGCLIFACLSWHPFCSTVLVVSISGSNPLKR